MTIQQVAACSNILVSKGASADGSTILAYNADDMGLFGSLDLRPAADHPAGTQRQVWDWDGQYYTGQIPEVNHTFNVVGNINENGVVITETTFGGRSDLDGHGTGALMSYGDLIWTALSRARTAREAIQIMDYLTQTFGYESDGESFGVGDDNEIWLLEMVGKGKYGKGSVWVASRIPEGYVGSTANQARTETFVQNDPENVMFAADVISFARQIGVYNGTDADFNFREAYDPISFSGARFGEARVWNLLNPACGGCLDAHLDFAQGYNLSNSMPLFVKAAHKLTLTDTITYMRTHFEHTWFDNTGNDRPDVGAGAGNSPYRFRPLTWESGGKTFLNERTVGVQQSGWAFIAQSRSWLPGPIKAVSWFAPDDSSTSPRIPTYGGATRIPAAFGSQEGQTPGGGVAYAPWTNAFTMSMDSAFWIWNLVGNIAWGERYGDAYPIVIKHANDAQAKLMEEAAAMEASFVSMYASDPAGAVEMMTTFMEVSGANLMQEWTKLWMFLFASFRDGGILLPSTGTKCVNGNTKDCTSKLMPGESDTGYSPAWRARIVADSDNAQRLLVPAAALSPEQLKREEAKIAVMNGKRTRRAH